MEETFRKFVMELKAKGITGKELYEQYASCKSAIRVLTDYSADLNQLILDEINELGVEKQVFEFGSFTKSEKTNWEYSPEVYQKEKQLKELKAKEQEEGVATSTKSSYLLFK